ncbi:MAG: S-isoprenylcysteine methyltransferase-like protein [Acidobacteria bacterium OLB17]|nr:MAG: S-isoprenylcysteine methyltransferase-like protein [Acidobacteria bacterium OLB17]MCZ2390758.1 isoprenylcysteine carboxylmethyltransferase family protein [Acidobacteriota bacterium]
MNGLELKIPPPVVALTFAAAMYGVAWAVPAVSFVLPGQPYISAVLLVLGIAVAVTGVLTFRRAGTTIDPRVPEKAASVVVHGIYRYTRNPMYLGILTVLAGWALYLSNAAAIVLLAGFVAYMMRFQIIPEERILRDKFGKPYDDYRSRVRRWI